MELATFGYPLYLLSFCHPEAGGRTGVFGEGELAVILVHLLCLHLVFSFPTLVVLAIAAILKVHILQVVRQIILGGEGEEDGGREGRGSERERERRRCQVFKNLGLFQKCYSINFCRQQSAKFILD